MPKIYNAPPGFEFNPVGLAAECQTLRKRLAEASENTRAVPSVPVPIDRKVRRVICAAIRADDGDLLLGIRHYGADMHAQINARGDGAKFYHRPDEHQGFVDQTGEYLTREEAYRVAEAAGQIAYPEACTKGINGPKLYSEGLY